MAGLKNDNFASAFGDSIEIVRDRPLSLNTIDEE